MSNQPESEGVRLSMSLNKGETKFVQERMVRVEKCLKGHGIECKSNHVPHIALLGSGGGDRAMIGLLGCLEQMYNTKLLDSVLYLCGVSGSTWCMTPMYEEPAWSSKFPSVKRELVKRLTEKDINKQELIKWLSQAIEHEHYSLTDFWAATVVCDYVKKINTNCLSDLKKLDSTDPYPIYTAIDQGLNKEEDKVGCWFELSPHEVGYSCLGAFVDTSNSESQFEDGVLKKKFPEKDVLYLQGLCGSALADGKEIIRKLKHSIWEWLKKIFHFGKENNASEEEIQPDLAGVSLDDILTKTLESILKLLDCKDDEEIARHLKEINLIMTRYGNEDGIDEDGVPLDDIASKTFESILNLFVEEIATATTDVNPENANEPEENLVRRSEEENLVDDFGGHPFHRLRNNSSCFTKVIKIFWKTMPVLATWTWGTKYNLLYKINLPVPEKVLSAKCSHLEDAGLLLNSPYVAALRPDRKVDLILSFDFSSGDPFRTVTQAAKLCQSAGIPFPAVEIPNKDNEKPKDCYVFKGNNTPTVIHFPLFNMVNTEGNVEKWRETYPTFHGAYNRKKMDELIRVSGLNVTNNKKKIIQEIAALCK